MPGIGIGISPLLNRGGGTDWSSYCRTLIMSLNPIFYIEDTTVVSGGYLVDSSGNNKQIAVTTDAEVNDTITMPANDTDIINALKADGSYYYFYTNDSTPKAVRIGQLILQGSRRLYSYYSWKFFCLLPTTPSLATQQTLYTALYISNAYLPDVNIVKALNFQKQNNPDAIITGGSYKAPLYLDEDSSIDDNVQPFLDSDKKIVSPITLLTTTEYPNVITFLSVGGNYKISFWVNSADLDAGGRNYLIAFYFSKWNVTKTQGITKANLTTLNYTASTSFGAEYDWTVTVKDVQSGWCRLEYSFFALSNGNINPTAFETVRMSIGIGYGTAVEQNINHSDILVTTGYDSTIVSGDILDGPFDKLSSNIFGKTICSIGDSITLGGRHFGMIQYLYGINQWYNCGVSGRKATHDESGDDIWQDRETHVAQDTDIYVIMLGANDKNSTLGEIGGDVDTYLGGYDEYLTYFTANLPDIASKKIILCTQPILVGAGNTIAEGKALYEDLFQSFADGVKALGVKYSLPVCDLHSLLPLTFENSAIYLLDKVHWTYAMQVAAADILGKFINDLYA